MDWHYQDSRTGERIGPTSQEVLADKVRHGEIDGDTLVWRVGLAQWAPAARMAEFASVFTTTTAMPPAPIAVAAPTVGYFAPRTDTPARVREHLRKYATSTGPVGEWPLNDDHVEQLSRAVLLRKRILDAYNLARLGGALYAIATAVVLVAALGSLASGPRAATYAWGMLAVTGVVGGLCAVFFVCARATWYCRSWGSLVMAILATVGCVGQIARFIFTRVSSAGGRDFDTALFITIFGVVLGTAFAFIFWRGWRATPEYLNTPVWCQEALAVAERTR